MSAVTITRTFAILPETRPFQSYKEMTDLFVKLRALKNRYVSLMAADIIKDQSFTSYSSTSMSRFRQAVYDRLKFSHVPSPQFQSYTLKERAKQCAFYDAYLKVREWIKRIETLKSIITLLMDKCTTDIPFIYSFLKGERFYSTQLKEIRKAVAYDCFAKKQSLSTFFLNNHLLQVRNLFLASNDFQIKDLASPVSKERSFQYLIKQKLSSLSLNTSLYEKIITGFYRRKKRKSILLSPDEILPSLFEGYIRKLQWKTTKQAQQILKIRKQMIKERKKSQFKKSRIEAYKKKMQRILYFLRALLGEVEVSSEKDFKHQRKALLAPFKQEILERISLLDLHQLIADAYHKEILELRQNPDQYILRRIFKPRFPAINVNELSYTAFLHYCTIKLQYKLRKLLKHEFLSEILLNEMKTQLSLLKEELYSRVPVPLHRSLSLSVMNRDVYKEDLSNDKSPQIRIGLLSRRFKAFHVKDEKYRIKTLKEDAFIPALPIITLKNCKLLLNLPFKKKIKEVSKPSLEETQSPLEMGIDLGLKHFAVVSIYNREQNKEVARYFLDPRNLFDKKVNPKNGVLSFPQIYSDKRHPSNIKWTLIKLRNQIRALQKKKNNYEQRLLSRDITRYRDKLKWNKIRKNLSLCWDRLHRINRQIVHYLNNKIIMIASYWNVSTIKVENLKWISHKNKKICGAFLSYWQTHWFYSQIQTAIEVQCHLKKISFKKVPAYKTSQKCSCCGEEGVRKEKTFLCTHCGFQLDADLNAARNIVKYTNKIIEIPYMGPQDCQLPVTKEDVMDVHKCPDF